MDAQDLVGDVEHDTEDVRDLQGLADLADPIVGRDVVLEDDNGPGGLAVKPCPSPQQPSPAAIA